jgi:AcrR family transcriptional regulator
MSHLYGGDEPPASIEILRDRITEQEARLQRDRERLMLKARDLHQSGETITDIAVRARVSRAAVYKWLETR